MGFDLFLIWPIILTFQLGGLNPNQWEALRGVNDLLTEDYKIRRETLIKVTICSFPFLANWW